MADINVHSIQGRTMEHIGRQLVRYFGDGTVDDILRCPGDLGTVVALALGQPKRALARGLYIAFDWTDYVVDVASARGDSIVSSFILQSILIIRLHGRQTLSEDLYRADGILHHLRREALKKENWLGGDDFADGTYPDDIRRIETLDAVNVDTIEGYTGRTVMHQIYLKAPL